MIPEPIPLAPLVIVLIILCAAFASAAATSSIAASKGRLTGEWVLWTLKSAESPAPAGSGDGIAEDASLRQVKVPWKYLAYGLAAGSAGLAILCGAVLMGPVSNYQHTYEHTVWAALGNSYGIHAAIPDQGFQSGVSFPAMLDGKTVECAATPPSMVVCDGTAIGPKK